MYGRIFVFFTIVSLAAVVDANAQTWQGPAANGTIYYNGGNVGIGTSAPGSLLTVAGNTSLNRLSVNTPYAGNVMQLGSSGPYTTVLNVRNASNTLSNIVLTTGAADEGLIYLGYGSAFPVLLNSNGASYLNGGNVGIGTTTPTAKLDVSGAIRGNSHLAFMPWVALAGSPVNGYVRLMTPIAANETNIFSLHVFANTYNGQQSVEIRCSGYAYNAYGLYNKSCTTTGTSLPVELTTEPVAGVDRIVMRIGTLSTPWLLPHFSVEYDGWIAKDPSAFTWSIVSGAVTPNSPALSNMNTVAIRHDDGGYVEIGQTTKPVTDVRLTVHGSATIDGNVVVVGNIGAKYQDVAEWVPVTTKMSPGTVVVVSADDDNSVTPSLRPYDTTVAGVVSAQPGLILGEASDSKAKIATTGRVKVRVDASKHAIKRGDLLVTSDKPGTAMYSEPIDVAGTRIHRPGTVLGKALESLGGGEGEILVLLSMQ